VEDSEDRAGPFPIAGQNYVVVLHEKRLAGVSDSPTASTLASVELRDVGGSESYSKAFPYAIEQGHFERSLSAFPQPVSGKTGAGLVIHYIERTASSGAGAVPREFWQWFGLVNGKLAPLGKPAPIGGPAAGGPYMGVIMKAANGGVSVISQPDAIEARVWTKFFYLYVPLRVDWTHGGLAQGQRCMEMVGGGLREAGCDLNVEAKRTPRSEEFTFVRLFAEAQENPDSAEHVVIQKDSKSEILGARAITSWNESGELIEPVFSDLWLHVRIDGHEGWIHGEEDFAAVGLPAGSLAP
jgi:hypothetical protein